MTPDDGTAWAADARAPSSRPIERYEQIAQLSRDMLAAAQRQNWEEVARLESTCRLLIEYLKRAPKIESMSPDEQRRRIELLREILRDDAQIRMRAEPWLLELERLIGMAPHAEGAG